MAEAGLSEETIAARSGASPDFVHRLVALGILAPTLGVGFTDTDVRRVRLVEALEQAGLSLDGLAEAMRSGLLSLDFVEQPAYDRFDAFTEMTFREVSEARGIPLDILLVVREAAGGPEARPDDKVRETELPVIAAGELLLRQGIRPETIAWYLRQYGESLRRLAETEADWWSSDLLGPLMKAGVPMAEIGRRTAAVSSELSRAGDETILALYHSHQANAWLRNIYEGFEATLAGQGLQARVERPPAIAFLDISGYTRMTEERGDEAARDLATALAQIVRRTSAQHGGRTVKWLGDGVMFHFPGSLARSHRLSRDDGDGHWGGLAPGPRGHQRRAGAQPGRRLPRSHGEHRVTDRRLCTPGRGARQPGRRRGSPGPRWTCTERSVRQAEDCHPVPPGTDAPRRRRPRPAAAGP